jgi:hypothetical protein
MAKQDLGEQRLSDSKERLRDALLRLEAVVDTRVQMVAESANDSEVASKLAEVTSTLQAKEQELESLKESADSGEGAVVHLREENQKLQAEVGETLESNKDLKKLNRRVGVRVDSLIAELKAVMQEQGV